MPVLTSNHLRRIQPGLGWFFCFWLLTARLFGQTNLLPQVEIQTVEGIRQLTAEQAAQHLPVRLEGTLSFFDGNLFACFFQDDTAGIYLVYDHATGLPPLVTGQKIRIEGVTSPGEFAPVVELKKVTPLGDGSFPTAKKISFEDIATGQEDSQFVEISGIVRSAILDPQENYYHLKIATGGGFLEALTNKKLPAGNADDLADSRVQIRGICTSRFNSQRQLYDVRLLVPRAEDLAIEIPAPTHPFDQPARRIEQLLQFVPHGPHGNRVKVSGTVIYRRDDQTLFIENEKEGLLVETRQTGPLLPGDQVEVLGFPAKGEYTPKLEDAIFRKTADGQVPLPENATAVEALKGTYDCRLVRIEATVLNRARTGQEQFLVLQSGGFIFNAYLEHKNTGLNFSYLENDSKVAVIGVCVIDPGNDWHVGPDWRAKSFRILMRNPSDIILLLRPPWWNLEKMLWAVGILIIGVLFALAWVAILRRRVQKQTAIIFRQLQTEAGLKERYENLFENANDMVFTHDPGGRITSINKTGEQLLRRPRGEILGQNLVAFVAEDQREAAKRWLEQASQGLEQTTTEWDFVTRSGQRLRLEISALLVKKAGSASEVECVARDITERKRLEREILEISNREQRRIGHDLHDGVCQQLVAIAYRMDILGDQLHEKNVTESAETERIGALLNETIHQTRSVARGLFPVRLDESGLESALTELAQNTTDLFKIDCRFQSQSEPLQLENSAALHLYYITQEAVLNAAKHGHATHVNITLSQTNGTLTLVVADDGSGFQAQVASRSTGMGIRIMRYRARVIGATLDLKSQPNQGTQITVQFNQRSQDSLEAK